MKINTKLIKNRFLALYTQSDDECQHFLQKILLEYFFQIIQF